MGAIKNIANKKTLLLSLYVFSYYLLYLYKVLTVTLCSAVVVINLNSRTFFNC